MSNPDSNISYGRFIDDLVTESPNATYDEIMQLAVGGSFESIGLLERELLIHYGLQQHDYVIDVGCGSGRLARPLSDYLLGKYLGIDIVPKLVEYAEKTVGRPDWRFETVTELHIPEKDDQADMVVFFSVFSHLRHEETFTYMQEAKRVLKPNGKIVFSYIEFINPVNWDIFQNNLNLSAQKPLNQFMSVSAIKIWANHLDLHVDALNLAGKVKLPRPVPLQDGNILKDTVLLGQSVCVLSKRSQPPSYLKEKLNNGLFRLANYLQRISI